jgi:hypothetical protein
MKRHSDKIIYFVLLCFLSCSLEAVRAEDAKGYYETSKPLVLHTLSGYGKYAQYNNAKLFVDANNRVIAFYSCKHGEKSFISVYDGNKWGESSTSASFSGGMVNNGTFQVYGHGSSGMMRICSLSSDMKLSSQPTNTIEYNSRKGIGRLSPLTGDPDKFFSVDVYTESRLNPFNLLPFLWSGGHGARAEKLFGATIEKGKVTGFYDVPGPVEENEYVSDISSVVEGNKVHTAWIKGVDYSSNPEVIKYSSFDLSNKRWSEPEELFKGDEERYKVNLYLSPPSLACVKENVYCVWSLELGGSSHMGEKEPKVEPGVYFCGKTNSHWGKPVKLFDSGHQPRVIIDNYGTIYVFWIEENKGLFYKRKIGTDWSERCSAVEDKEISEWARGLPPFMSPPISIGLDRDNNFHIIYIRESSGVYGKEGFKPEELVYVKLTQTQKQSRVSGGRL